VKGWNVNFHKWKGIWIYKRCLNCFPFHRKAPRKKTILVSYAHDHPLCVVRIKKKNKNRKLKRPWKKEEEKNIPKVNLILLHANHTFLILDPWIEPQAFKHTHCTLRTKVFFNVKEGPIQGSICFKLVLGLLVHGPLFKVVALIYIYVQGSYVVKRVGS
jgi:hypothetical protein